MEADASAALAPCRNCGAVPVAQTPAPHYCARCGQERTLHPPTLAEFLHEFVGHYVALEGPLWRSLGLLLGRPGRLTREYLEGRRRRYVLPLRLYLSASFLFFVVMKLIPTAAGELVSAGAPDAPVAVTAASANAGASESASAGAIRGASASSRSEHAPSGADDVTIVALPSGRIATGQPRAADGQRHVGTLMDVQVMDCDTPGHAACSRIERWVKDPLERARQDPHTFVEHLRAHALAIAPYAIFLLLPVFAALVMLAYRGRGRTYGEHFVFSLHLHAFWFLALLAMALLPRDGSDLVVFAVPIYGVMALRTVYGGGWTTTLLRATLVSLLYAGALLVATMGLLAALLATS